MSGSPVGACYLYKLPIKLVLVCTLQIFGKKGAHRTFLESIPVFGCSEPSCEQRRRPNTERDSKQRSVTCVKTGKCRYLGEIKHKVHLLGVRKYFVRKQTIQMPSNLSLIAVGPRARKGFPGREQHTRSLGVREKMICLRCMFYKHIRGHYYSALPKTNNFHTFTDSFVKRLIL